MPEERQSGKRQSHEREREDDPRFQLTTEVAVSAPDPRIKQNGLLWLKERLGEANGHAKIGTAKPFDNRECHANYFALAIDERSARPAGSGLSIVDNFVGKNVADVALSDQGANEFPASEFVQNLFRFSASLFGNIVHGVFPCPRENSANARGITKG